MKQDQAHQLEIKLLGTFEVCRWGVPLEAKDWKRRKTKVLLWILLSERGKAFSSDQLIELLFSNLTPKKAQQNLRSRVSELRYALEPELKKGADSQFILHEGEGYCFSASAPCWLDTEVIEEKLNQAYHLIKTERWAQALELYDEAHELYQGEYLPEALYDEWTQRHRSQWQERITSAWLDQADCHARLGELQRAIECCRKALEIEPYRETTFRQIMLYHAYAGRTEEALKAYHECIAVLRDHLDVDPSADTEELRDLILRGKIVKPAQEAPTNLPGPSDAFIGRRQETAQILELLGSKECRLLTLIGPGGVGKTRLAVEAASIFHRNESFPDGVFFVDLSATESREHVITATASALGFSFYGKANPLDQLSSYLRSKEILLVLDNLEQLAADADLFDDLIESTSHSKMLATSRERLHLSGEWLLELKGLGLPGEATSLPESEMSKLCESEQLFYERVRRHQPDFQANAKVRVEIQEICRLLEGSPLAIELAVSWLRVLTCEEVAEALRTNLGALQSKQSDLPVRHQSLRAVFEHSSQMLSPEEQRVFQALTIFQGGFSRDAAEAVTNAPVATLLGLMDKSLVTRSLDRRFKIHELLRQFGAERLAKAPQQMEKCQITHGQYYLRFLRDINERLIRAASQQSLDQIDLEINNIRTAWDWAIASSSYELLGGALDSLFRYYDIKSLIQEGEVMFWAAANALSNSQSELQARLDGRLGWFTFRLGRMAEARELLHEARKKASSKYLLADEALFSHYLGVLDRIQGNYISSREHHQHDLDISRELNDVAGMARASNNMGTVLQEMGEYDRAKSMHDQGLQFYEEIGDELGVSKALTNLGIVARLTGNPNEAIQLYKRSLKISQEMGDRFGICADLANLGNCAFDLGNDEESKHYYEEGLVIAREMGEAYITANLHSGLSQVEDRLGNEPQALEHFCSAASLTLEMGAVPTLMAYVLASFSLLHRMEYHELLVQALSITTSDPASQSVTRAEAEERLGALKSQLPEETFDQAINLANGRSFLEVVEEILCNVQKESSVTRKQIEKA